jgi:hypothetical protein
MTSRIVPESMATLKASARRVVMKAIRKPSTESPNSAAKATLAPRSMR